MADTVTPGALFDAPADGQLFAAGPAVERPKAPKAQPFTCPACGRGQTRRGLCVACDRRGYGADVLAAALELPEAERPRCFCTVDYCAGTRCGSRPTRMILETNRP